MNTENNRVRVYVLVQIQPGHDKDFTGEILSKGLISEPKGERIDFVHGTFDYVVILEGVMENIDSRIIEMRKSPFVRATETLISLNLSDVEDVSGRLDEP